VTESVVLVIGQKTPPLARKQRAGSGANYNLSYESVWLFRCSTEYSVPGLRLLQPDHILSGPQIDKLDGTVVGDDFLHGIGHRRLVDFSRLAADAATERAS
jgi:hypothetical protein